MVFGSFTQGQCPPHVDIGVEQQEEEVDEERREAKRRLKECVKERERGSEYSVS